MKLYWAEGRGCVIASANLSKNALGLGSLKEIGVYLPPGALNIDQVLNALDRRDAEPDLPLLDVQSRVLAARDERFRSTHKALTFLEWYNTPGRPSWSVLWFEGTDQELSKNTRRQLAAEFPDSTAYNWFWSRKRTVREGDWVMCVPTSTAGGQTPSWMYIDRLFDVPARERLDGYRFEAVQIHAPAYYEAPPFSVTDPRIKRAIKHLAQTNGARESEWPEQASESLLEGLLATGH